MVLFDDVRLNTAAAVDLEAIVDSPQTDGFRVDPATGGLTASRSAAATGSLTGNLVKRCRVSRSSVALDSFRSISYSDPSRANVMVSVASEPRSGPNSNCKTGPHSNCHNQTTMVFCIY